MRLSEFILENREPILVEWEEFARTCKPASTVMDITALRDHADEMLSAIAADLATPQSQHDQKDKGKGLAAEPDAGPATAAAEHGAGRAESGFTVGQMVAEYRALRASVVRLWTAEKGNLEPADIEDLTRFNEAIDQSLAESVSRYAGDLEHSKEMFLAILAHDLRTPLGAVLTSAAFMVETGELEEPHRTLADRIAASARRMVTMVGDLLDFTRSRLGGGIPITRGEVSLGKILHDVVDEISATGEDLRIEVETRGEQKGEWDGARLEQALINLVANAVQHGSEGAVVTVQADGDDEEARVAIHNEGPPIPAERLDGIFNPLKPSTASRGSSSLPTGNLGLGLYIAERIVNAHNGRIEIESSAGEGTTFTVHLPRRG